MKMKVTALFEVTHMERQRREQGSPFDPFQDKRDQERDLFPFSLLLLVSLAMSGLFVPFLSEKSLFPSPTSFSTSMKNHTVLLADKGNSFYPLMFPSFFARITVWFVLFFSRRGRSRQVISNFYPRMRRWLRKSRQRR